MSMMPQLVRLIVDNHSLVDVFPGNALDEDLSLGELHLSSYERDNDNDTNSVCSSLSAGFPPAGWCALGFGRFSI